MGQKAQLHPNARTCSIGLEVTPLTQYNPFSGLVGHSVQRHLLMLSSESVNCSFFLNLKSMAYLSKTFAIYFILAREHARFCCAWAEQWRTWCFWCFNKTFYIENERVHLNVSHESSIKWKGLIIEKCLNNFGKGRTLWGFQEWRSTSP